MTGPQRSTSEPAAPCFRAKASCTRELLRLAWPAALSYILNNAYRINDQFWVQGLGEEAQSALGATFFVLVLNFSVVFLAMGGTLSLVARSIGARDTPRRDAVIRNALLLALGIGCALTAGVLPWMPEIVDLLGLTGGAATSGVDYLGTLYLFVISLALFPVIDSIFIGMGNTRIPMMLQGCAVALNYALNPILIYGPEAAENMNAPGAEIFGAIAGWLGIEGQGIAGAALATGIARTLVAIAGLVILHRVKRVRLLSALAPRESLTRMLEILRISLPSSLSIGIYALAYLGLLRYVLTPLGDAVTGGLGVGFQVFEGAAFPCYLGLALASSTLVGREIGAGDPETVRCVVGSARSVGRILGLIFAFLFWFVAPELVQYFTQDADIARETTLYVRVLAFSQYFVAVEVVNEKVLLGSGRSRPILWISMVGNLLRLPLGWWFVLEFAQGAVGVWWAINLTTLIKASLYWLWVQRSSWLEDALRDEARVAGSYVKA